VGRRRSPPTLAVRGRTSLLGRWPGVVTAAVPPGWSGSITRTPAPSPRTRRWILRTAPVNDRRIGRAAFSWPLCQPRASKYNLCIRSRFCDEGQIMETTRRLYRSKSDRKLGGVCGGLGEYLGADPTLIRVVFIVLAVLGGAGLIIYLAMWLIVPQEP
jgi:phage shock protein C